MKIASKACINLMLVSTFNNTLLKSKPELTRTNNDQLHFLTNIIKE